MADTVDQPMSETTITTKTTTTIATEDVNPVTAGGADAADATAIAKGVEKKEIDAIGREIVKVYKRPWISNIWMPNEEAPDVFSADEIAKIETILGFKFADPKLMEMALCHKTLYIEGRCRSFNQRLEFIGDAILSHAVALELYRRYPYYDEAALTINRKTIVDETSLDEKCRELTLNTFVRLGVGEDRIRKTSNSLNADAMEAMIGAICLDANGGHEKVSQLIVGWFADKLSKASHGDKENAKGSLLELIQQACRGKYAPEYKVTEMTGASHQPIFNVKVTLKGLCIGKGSGTSKQKAEMAASREALRMFNARKEYLQEINALPDEDVSAQAENKEDSPKLVQCKCDCSVCKASCTGTLKKPTAPSNKSLDGQLMQLRTENEKLRSQLKALETLGTSLTSLTEMLQTKNERKRKARCSTKDKEKDRKEKKTRTKKPSKKAKKAKKTKSSHNESVLKDRDASVEKEDDDDDDDDDGDSISASDSSWDSGSESGSESSSESVSDSDDEETEMSVEREEGDQEDQEEGKQDEESAGLQKERRKRSTREGSKHISSKKSGSRRRTSGKDREKSGKSRGKHRSK